MRISFELKLIAALIFTCSAVFATEQRAQYIGSYTWNLDKKWFGGFSGLHLSADGQQMMLITDRATVLSALIERDGDQVTSIFPGRHYNLRGTKGLKLDGRIVDSEGLAVAPDGTLFVSFERVHRVARYPNPNSASQVLDRPQFFREMPYNGSFEALAMDGSGRLYILPENALNEQGDIPVYRWEGAGWSQPFSLNTDGNFKPVGADFGPDGQFYLLERGYNIFGFRSRIRSWNFSEASATEEKLILQTATGTHDNLEGLSVWSDQNGRLRLTMIADDNFFFLQHTELVEYFISK